jgi:nitrilase
MSNSMQRLRTVAVVQAGTVLGDLAGTMRKLEEFCAECARNRARLAVFPEAFIGGYPKGMSFGASVGIRTDEGRALFHEYANNAIQVPGQATEELGRIASTHGLYLVVGVIERAGGTLYCTALYLGPDGRLLGKHRKLVPTAVERLIWGCGDGSTLEVCDTEVGRFGALVCWENYMPLARMAMYRQNIELYCAPTVDDRETWLPTMRHVAREGRCFVLSSCQYLARDAYPANWLASTENLPATPIRGNSCIVDPMGTVLAGPLFGKEGVLIATINLADLVPAKFDLDVVGHYDRPDVFQLKVDTTAR